MDALKEIKDVSHCQKLILHSLEDLTASQIPPKTLVSPAS